MEDERRVRRRRRKVFIVKLLRDNLLDLLTCFLDFWLRYIKKYIVKYRETKASRVVRKKKFATIKRNLDSIFSVCSFQKWKTFNNHMQLFEVFLLLFSPFSFKLTKKIREKSECMFNKVKMSIHLHAHKWVKI